MKLQAILENKPQREQDAWDLFGSREDRPKPKVVAEIQQPTTISYQLKLYRGFDANLDDIHRRGDQLVLSPTKSEQGLLWFTHELINGYNALEYVQGRGNYILTYPLDCVRHIQREVYDDGSYYDRIPQEILDTTDSTSNSRLYMGIEVPDGWIFSYKMEKFIGCNQELLITTDMLTPQ